MLKSIAQRHFNFKRFFRGEGPQSPPYTLHRRRVYILPTMQGLVFAILIFTMLLASVNYSNSLGYMLTFLLASLAIISIFHTYGNLLSLDIGPAISKPAFANQPSRVTIQINNHALLSRSAVACYLPGQQQIIEDIKANGISYINLPITFSRRGYQALPRFVIETTFPLGFFRAWSHVELQQSVLVYPSPASDRVLPQCSAGDQEGDAATSVGQDDFAGLRNYQAGDSLYHVHWKTAAKHHILQTKQYVGSASTELMLRWNDSVLPDTEGRLSQLTRWVLLADASGLPYGLQIPGIRYPADTGMAHKTRCLTALALYGTKFGSRHADHL